ncbi:hypothetical protein E0H73_40810 [Kribbella pittospori]|uniref:Uncharacterized protein n=1 Tax=Kribbella pittospori TaxID=722689 RepID=A0A4R0K8I4_9ACTN|nr:hypothetical protein [Kribbella pittospori]TCC51465.1 hypothetical protein E0H73_40810 [Kribbella pittospori]
MTVIGPVAVAVLITIALCVVAILSVVLKASDQRADGLRLLQQLGRTLERIVGKVDLFRRKRRDDNPEPGRPADWRRLTETRMGVYSHGDREVDADDRQSRVWRMLANQSSCAACW